MAKIIDLPKAAQKTNKSENTPPPPRSKQGLSPLPVVKIIGPKEEDIPTNIINFSKISPLKPPRK